MSQQGERSVIGSWFATITAADPSIAPFRGIMSLHEGGVVTEARRYYVVAPPPFEPMLETSGGGAWKRTGERTYEIFFRFLLQQAPPSTGNEIGTDNVRLQLTYDPAADTLSGTFASQIKGVDGGVIAQFEGTYAAERIKV